YGFNGQEKDDEIAGNGNINTAEFWQYDTRLGRRWNIDPVVKPSRSGYSTFANNPIAFADPSGLDEKNQADANARKDVKDGDTYVDKKGASFSYNGELKSWMATESTASDNNPQAAQKSNSDAPVTFNMPTPQQMEEGGNNRLPVVNDILPNAAWLTQAPNWKACFTTCQKILSNNGVKNPAPRNLAIQMTTENFARNGLNISPTANQGLDAINQSLRNGAPIIVGVNHTFGNGYNEGTTDHFVIINGSGHNQQGRLYYKFFDVGTERQKMGTSTMNRLYLQNNNTLSGVTQYNQRRYTVSQVRPNGQ
ncbi:MAG: hypothetical protein ACK504_07795, partial [Bacteroidota bacterium]